MEDNRFYVYEWFNIETNEVFYVGKGVGKRAFDVKARNKIFQEYYQNHACSVRIVQSNLSEDEAFAQEKIITDTYKALGWCQANLAEAGHGGIAQVWTPELRQYWSEHNPMKDEKQRQRMSENNPMKNPEIAQRVGNTKKRAVIIDGNFYAGLVDAARELNVHVATIQAWLKQGHNSQWKPCRYADEEQKPYEIRRPGKPVIIDGIWYATGAEGARAIGVIPQTLCRALKEHRDCQGHKCEYANQQPSQENSNSSILEGSTTNG